MLRKFSAISFIVILSLVLSGGWTATGQTASAILLAPEVTLGEPGTSFRYVNTIGETEAPYPADTDHLYGPNGLFIDSSDNLYVVEQARGMRMLKYADTGANLLAIGHPGYDWHHDDYLSWPTDVHVAPGGRIWVTMNSALKEFDQTGAMLQIFPEVDPWNSGTDNDRFDNLRGLAFDSAGLMYVSDSNNHRVQIYDISSGTPVYNATLGITGSPGDTDTQFNGPYQIAFDNLDRLYVVDRFNHRVQRCVYESSDWTCSTFLGETGVPGDDLTHLNSPWGIGINSDQIFIADFQNARVLKCDTSADCSVFAGETGVFGSDNDHFNLVADVAVDSVGNVYVSDRSNHRIQKFNSSGVYLETIGEALVPYSTTGTYFNHPVGVTVDPEGSVYVVENWGNRLVKVDAAESVEWTFGSAGIYGPGNDNLSDYWALPEGKPAVDANGLVYVADSSKHRVLVLNPDGSYFDQIGEDYTPGNGPYNFDFPTGVAISPVNGDVYVVDRWNNRIQVFTSARVYKATLGIVDECDTTSQHFCGPWDVTIDPNGNIFVADTDNLRVQKCTLTAPTYSCTTFAGETGVFDTDFGHLRPLSVAVDAAGNVYVADEWDNQRIQVYDPTGAYLTTIGGTWSFGNGGFNNPKSVAVDADGNVYVADEYGMRIQVFAPGYPGWTQANINGFGDRDVAFASALAAFDGKLYASTWVSTDSAYAEVWRTSDGKHWTEFTPTWTNSATGGSAVFNNYLYFGVSGDPYGEIWRTDGQTWEQVISDGFGDTDVNWVNDLEVFSGFLYAVTVDSDSNLQIYRSDTGDAGDWDPVEKDAFGGSYTVWQDKVFGVFGSYLYLGFGRDGLAELWRTDDGLSWDPVFIDGLAADNTSVSAFEAFNGELYIGFRNVNAGGEVWRSSDGLNFSPVITGGMGDAANARPYGLQAYGGELFLSFTNYDTGANLFKTTDGDIWTPTVVDGWGDSNNVTATYFDKSNVVYNGSLYFSASNSANGAEIWQYTSQNKLYLPIGVKSYSSNSSSAWATFASPTSNHLHALDMVSTSDGWVVGEQGTILRWNGAAWSNAISPVPNDLMGIDLLDSSTGWAVGSGGAILRWNGTAWSSAASPTSTNLKDVHILAANDAWAVGEGGVILHWNGTAWSTSTSPTSYDLFAVDFISSTDGWAVGGEWDAGINWYRAAYLHWNGSAWTNYTPVMVLDLLFDVDLVSSSYGVAAGLNNAKSFWNGTSWNQSYAPPMLHYEGVHFLAANDGWAVGWEVGGNNIQHWDGSTWVRVACPTTNQLNDVFMLSTTQGWAVGENGVILSYGP